MLKILVPFGAATNTLPPVISDIIGHALPVDDGWLVLVEPHEAVRDLAWPEGAVGQSAARFVPSYVPPSLPATKTVTTAGGTIEAPTIPRMRPADLPTWLAFRRGVDRSAVTPTNTSTRDLVKRWAPHARALLGLPDEMPEGETRRRDGTLRISAGGATALEQLFVQDGIRGLEMTSDAVAKAYVEICGKVWEKTFPAIEQFPEREAFVDADGQERPRARGAFGADLDEDINGVPLTKTTIPATVHPTPPLPIMAHIEAFIADAITGRVAWLAPGELKKRRT